jgi:hypothetical protein
MVTSPVGALSDYCTLNSKHKTVLPSFVQTETILVAAASKWA